MDGFRLMLGDTKLVETVRTGHHKDIPDVLSKGWRRDLVMSVFYDKIIKPWVIGKGSKIIILHNGPLPMYRGVSPINRPLKNSGSLTRIRCWPSIEASRDRSRSKQRLGVRADP
jgi:hypothetical protein